MQQSIICYFDGACEPHNPGGNMGLGAVIFIDDALYDDYSYFVRSHPKNSNNVAEYGAFKWLLETLLRAGLHENLIYIYGDSKLVIEQMNKRWRIRFGHYVYTALECKELLKNFRKTIIRWIPREKNELADKLSKGIMIENNVEFKIQPL